MEGQLDVAGLAAFMKVVPYAGLADASAVRARECARSTPRPDRRDRHHRHARRRDGSDSGSSKPQRNLCFVSGEDLFLHVEHHGLVTEWHGALSLGLSASRTGGPDALDVLPSGACGGGACIGIVGTARRSSDPWVGEVWAVFQGTGFSFQCCAMRPVAQT